MASIQIIKTPAGEEMVLLSRADYEALVTLAEEAMEDAADVAITTTFGLSWLRNFEVVSYEAGNDEVICSTANASNSLLTEAPFASI